MATLAWLNPTVVQNLRPFRNTNTCEHRTRLSPKSCSLAQAPSDSRSASSTPTAVKTPLLTALLTESNRVAANFFCPGHKQGATLHPDLRRLLGVDAFHADLPELPALDNLFAPEGVIEEAQRLASNVFTSQGSAVWTTRFLVNGTTCGIEAAILSTVRPDGCVVLPRNAHQSAVHALVLSGATPVWVDPVYDTEHDLLHGVTVDSVEDALRCAPSRVDAVLIVSPTYHGVLSDVREIAKVAHRYGAKLIVDEAHGAHLPFHDDLPESATECDADFVVQSTHKTLTAFTQAAMLHVRHDAVDESHVSAALQLVQSTSPNYLLLASLDATRALMQGCGYELMTNTIMLARSCAQRVATLKGFSVLGLKAGAESELGESNPKSQRGESMYALDPTRITVLLPGHVTGYDLDTHLIDRFGVYAELPSFRHVTFVVTPGTTQEDIDTLVASLAVYNATSEGSPSSRGFKCGSMGIRDIKMTPRQAFFAPSTTVDVSASVGRVCAETLCPYPPGIPVLFPGEVVTQESIGILKAVLDAGGSVSGARDDTLSTIRVIKDH